MGPCKTPLCPNTRTLSSPYCSSCAPQAVIEDRGSAAARGYGHRWRKLRLMVLRRDPLCADPFAIHCVSASRHADHIVPKRIGGQDTLENLQGLCDSCHSRKTFLERSVCFTDSAQGSPTSFTIAGRVITLWTAANAPPEAKPIRLWASSTAEKLWGQGWVKSLELLPARPTRGRTRVVAK